MWLGNSIVCLEKPSKWNHKLAQWLPLPPLLLFLSGSLIVWLFLGPASPLEERFWANALTIWASVTWQRDKAWQGREEKGDPSKDLRGVGGWSLHTTTPQLRVTSIS